MSSTNNVPIGTIDSAQQLGSWIRDYRKSQKLTLDEVSYTANTGVRFLSELERGKDTAHLGKTLAILEALGLELSIRPRHKGQHGQHGR